MEIPEPPASGTGLESIISRCVNALNTYFGPCWGAGGHASEKSFEAYKTQFDWFAPGLPIAPRILNVGCYLGRETFALMWRFRASEAVGIDICTESVGLVESEAIKPLANLGHFVGEFLSGRCGSGLPAEYIERLRNWWENEVPPEIRSAATGHGVPSFIECDVADAASVRAKLQGGYDLVYCCHVLDEIANDGGDLKGAIRNMGALVTPEIGRIVVVGATQRVEDEPKHAAHFVSLDELARMFRSEGLTLMAEETLQLGYLDWPESRPGGLVFARG